MKRKDAITIVLENLKNFGPKTVKQVAKSVYGIGENKVRNIMFQLEREGQLERDGQVATNPNNPYFREDLFKFVTK